MFRRHRLASLAIAAFLVAGLAAPVAAAPTWTTPVTATGTTGWGGVQSVIAKDGTVIIVRAVGLSGTTNRLEARVRAPGANRFRSIAQSPEGDFLGLTSLVASPDGDGWAATTADGPAGVAGIRLWRIDVTARRWVPAGRPFRGAVERDYRLVTASLTRAGDGTFTIAGIAAPKSPPAGDPVYRIVVATGRAGGSFATRFLTSADVHATTPGIAGNARGEIVVPFIQGYSLAEMTPRVAIRSAAGRWRTITLGAAGDSQRIRAAIGPDGTVGVTWLAPANAPFTEVELVTLGAGCGTSCIATHTLTTGLPAKDQIAVAVEADGDVLAGWVQPDGSATRIWLAHVDGGVPTPQVVSEDGRKVRLSGLVPIGGSRIGMIGVLFTTGFDGLGLRYWPVRNGTAGSMVTLTGSEAADGAVNDEQLGFAKGLGTITWRRGSFPTTTVSVTDQRR